MFSAPILPPKWAEQAKCAGHPGLYDADRYSRSRGPGQARARKMCQGCPVWAECAEMAVEYQMCGVLAAGKILYNTPEENHISGIYTELEAFAKGARMAREESA